MLKYYLRKLIENYLQEIDIQNAINLVKMDVDDLLEEIIEEKAEQLMNENLFYYYVLVLSDI